MISTIHDECNTGSNGAELADDQLITCKIKKIFYVLLKAVYIFKIIVVGIITNFNLRIGNNIFKETKPFIIGYWKIRSGDGKGIKMK